MPDPIHPTDVARETLKLLAGRRLSPTPENYRKIYEEIAGAIVTAEVSGVEQVLRALVRQLDRDAAAVAEKALAERDWEALEDGLLRLLGQAAEEQVPWADLIRDLLKQWELKQNGLTTVRKKEGLERLLINFGSDPRLLPQKLRALINSWASTLPGKPVPMDDAEETPAEGKTPQPEAALPAGEAAAAAGQETSQLWRQALVQALETGIAPRLTKFPELSGEAMRLAGMAGAAQDGEATARFSKELTQFWIKLELRGETDAEIMDGLLRLLKLLVDNIGELTLDDQWLRGQIAVVQDIISKPLSPRVIYDAETGFKEVIYKQSNLKHSLNEAKATLKSLMSTFFDRLGEMSVTATEYHQRIEQYSQQISQTEDIAQLNQILGDVLRDTKGMQLDVLRSRDELEMARKRVAEAEERVQSLETELDKVTALVHEDHLTGTLNRRGMEDAFAREFARAERLNSPICVALLDIDHFKRLNDTYGHDAGDEALVHLVKVVKQTLRPTDVVARFGGEEFVVILPDTPEVDGVGAMTRLQRELTKRFFLHKNERLLITFSAGVALRGPDESPDAIIARVDKALYEAKRAGRNRVFAAAKCPSLPNVEESPT